MHRVAAKIKPARKQRPIREGRRSRIVEREVSTAAGDVPVPFARPANDTGADLDFAGEPTVDSGFGRVVDELDSVAETLAVVEPEVEDDSLPAVLAANAAVGEIEPTEDLPEEPEAEDDADPEIGAEAESDDEAAAPSPGGPKSDEPQSFLAMYFRDMAELSVLKPEQEFETARHIEELELDLWQALLTYAAWASHLATTVETAMGRTLPEFKSYRMLSERAARKGPSAEKRKLSKATVALAAQIKELDIDRVFVDAALTELQRLSGAARMGRPIERLGFNTESKPFQEFVTTITNKSGIVKRAKNEFVKANLRLVVSIARRFNHGRLPLPDLIQEGNIGLMKAVERYDYRRGFRFSTYASWWIRHAISRALADKGRAVRLPVHDD